jgi:topoisomerase-4 subunit A
LIDGQGNFGNIDGDGAAAMRYTEARMTEVAKFLLDGIDEDAVDFRPTYDGSENEPVVLPGGFPNLLANGSSGIAVGMATNIPPFNVAEMSEAMLAMLEGDIDEKQLAKYIPGPDFPTGGVLAESKDAIIESYRTGRGSYRIRARWEKEEIKGGGYQIVITEIPYQVQKSKLVERIAELITTKKIPLLDDVRDESAEDIRLVIVPKSRNVEAELLMEMLFRNSDLEVKFGLNMNVLGNGLVPRVMSLKEVLKSWLDHQREVLIRRSNYRLDKVLHRLEVLEGYLIVYLNIDEVIKIIRTSDEPKAALIKKFKLTEIQAEAVLNIRLRSLAKLEEIEIKREHDKLTKEKEELEKLLKSEARQWTAIKKQVAHLGEVFGKNTKLGKRRTLVGKAAIPVLIENIEEAMIEKEPITMILSAKGWIRAMKGHELETKDLKYKDGDKEAFVIEAMTTDKIVLFGTNGVFYTIGGDKLPSGRGFGEPLRLMVDLPNDADIVDVAVYNAEAKMIVSSDDGRGFVVNMSDVLAQTKKGKQVLNVDTKAEAKLFRFIEPNHDHVAVIGKNRKFVVFKLDQVPEMSRGKGVILQKYKDGGLSDLKTFNWKQGLAFKYGSGETVVGNLKEWLGNRADAGKLPPNGFPKSNKFF